MAGTWKFAATTLVLLAVLTGLGVCCAGLFSAPDLVVISLVASFSVSMIAAWGLAVCYFITLRLNLRKYLNRRPLSDEEFVALLGLDVQIDLVRKVRQIAARRFWLLTADCFYPGDPLIKDLHLADRAPWGLEDFWYDFENYFGPLNADSVQREIVTFGDVISEANRRREGRNTTSSR